MANLTNKTQDIPLDPQGVTAEDVAWARGLLGYEEDCDEPTCGCQRKRRILAALTAAALSRERITEVVVTDREAVVLGVPATGVAEDSPDYHNCDAMGCGQAHVLYRQPCRAPALTREQEDAVRWVRGMTLIPENTEVREAALNYVKPSEYQRAVNNLLDRLLGVTREGA